MIPDTWKEWLVIMLLMVLCASILIAWVSYFPLYQQPPVHRRYSITSIPLMESETLRSLRREMWNEIQCEPDEGQQVMLNAINAELAEREGRAA